MKRSLYFAIICLGLYAVSACKKKTVFTLYSPLDSLKKMAGTRQWHGRFSHDEWDDSGHIVPFDTPVTMPLTITFLNDSVILLNLFTGSDSIYYMTTDESRKIIQYNSRPLPKDIYLGYDYAKDSIIIDASWDSGTFTRQLYLVTP